MSNLIEEFLKQYTDKNLWIPICNRIGKSHFDIDVERGNKLDISLNTEANQNDEDTSFWKGNITEYPHLYVFVLLGLWKETNPNSESIKNRFESYSKEKEIIAEIIAECEKFVIQSDIIPERILLSIGFVIDAFLWKKNRTIPFFFSKVHENNPVFEIKYNQYVELFKDSIIESQFEQIKEQLNDLLLYCNVIDLGRKEDCFMILIKKISGTVNNMRISAMLNIIVDNYVDIGCDFDSLKKIMNYYCENNKILLKTDIDIIKNIQLKLYKIRISEYLNKYGVFLNLNSIKNIANNVDYFDWASPLYNSECLKIWTTCVKPWNYIQYYEETKLKDFRQFMTSFRNYIIKRCSINIQSVIKQAESNGHNKTWAINIFEKWVKMIIDDSLRDYKKNIHSHLQKYKKSKIEECVYNAIKDCQLKAIDKIWNSSPQIEVHIIENAVMANSEIQIYIKYSIKDTIKMIFLFPSPMNDNPFDEMIVIPTEYIKWAVNKRRSWGTWVNISVENNEKEKKLLNDTLDWYQDIALMSIIYYLDYDYIKLYERYSMNSEDNSTTNICSNSIDSDSWSEKGLDNLIGNYAEYP